MSAISSVPPDLRPRIPSLAVAGAGIGARTGMVRPPKAPRSVKVPAKPPSDAALANQQVAALYDPILKQLNDAYAARTGALSSALNAGSNNLAQLMGQYGPAVQHAYDTASGGLSAINAALAATQQGQGAAAQTQLASELGGIDANTVGRVTGGQAGDWQGMGLANATKGANNLAMLLSEGAHAGEYGAKLPAIGGEIGFNALRQALGQATSQQDAALQDYATKRAAAGQDALTTITSNRQKQQQLNFEDSLKQATLGLSKKKANASIAQGNARTRQGAERVGIAQQNANTSATRAADASARGWAQIGISRQRLTQAEAKATAARKAKGITPGQLASIQAKAEKDAELFYNGVPAVTRADGSISKQPTYSRTYQDALKALVNRYPALGPSGVLKILNSLYKPGQFGRPAGKGIHFVNGNPVFGR